MKELDLLYSQRAESEIQTIQENLEGHLERMKIEAANIKGKPKKKH